MSRTGEERPYLGGWRKTIGRKDIAIILLSVMTILALGGPSVVADTSTTNTADETTFTGCQKNGKLESVAIGGGTKCFLNVIIITGGVQREIVRSKNHGLMII